MAQQVDVILFDLGNVIVDFDTSRIVTDFSRRCESSPEEIARLISTSPLYHDFERGNMSPDDFHRAAQSHLSLSISFAEFLPVWNDIFTAKPAMETFAREMKKRYRIAALSNTNELHWNFLKENFDIMQVFDDYFLSFELHCRKPEEEIYKKALNHYRLPAERIAYIDDVPAFVAVARSLGIQGHVFTSIDDIRNRMLSP